MTIKNKIRKLVIQMGFDFFKKLGNSIQKKFKINLSKNTSETMKNNNNKLRQDMQKKEIKKAKNEENTQQQNINKITDEIRQKAHEQTYKEIKIICGKIKEYIEYEKWNKKIILAFFHFYNQLFETSSQILDSSALETYENSGYKKKYEISNNFNTDFQSFRKILSWLQTFKEDTKTTEVKNSAIGYIAEYITTYYAKVLTKFSEGYSNNIPIEFGKQEKTKKNHETEIKKDKSHEISIDDNLIENFNNISCKINSFVEEFNIYKTTKEVNENLLRKYYDIYSSLFYLLSKGEKIQEFDLSSWLDTNNKITDIISIFRSLKYIIEDLHNKFINNFNKNKSYFKFWKNLPNSEKKQKKNSIEKSFNEIKKSLENLLNIKHEKLIECFDNIAKKKQIAKENEIKKQEEIRRKLAEAKKKEEEAKRKRENEKRKRENEQQRYEKIENAFNSIDQKMSTFLEQYNLYLKNGTIENSDAPEEFYDIYNKIIDCLENNNSDNFDNEIYDLKRQEWKIKFDNDGNLEDNSAKELEIICKQLLPFIGLFRISTNHVGKAVCDKLSKFYGNFYQNPENLKKYFKTCYLNTKNIPEPDHTMSYETNNSEIIKQLDGISEEIDMFIENYLLYKKKNKVYKEAPLDYYNIYIKLFDISEKIFNHDTRAKFAYINKPGLVNLINAEKLKISNNNIDNDDAYLFLVKALKMPKISMWFLNFAEIISEVDYKIVGDKIKKSIIQFTKILLPSLLSYFKDCYLGKIDENEKETKKSKLNVSFDKIIKKINKFTKKN